MKTKPAVAAVVLFAVLAAFSPGAAQVEPPYDPTILPQENSGSLLPFEAPATAASSGAARLSHPVPLPPGRRGLAPRLALEYNSAERSGLAGVGWNLALGAIQRSCRNGLDFLGVAFEHDGEELAARADWGSGWFGLKREEGFSKYRLLSPAAGWVVTSRDGRRYVFGSHAGSRLEGPNGVFRWCLERVEDPNGNFYAITYFKDQGQIYPQRIDYTGHAQAAPTHAVLFAYASRPDPVVSYLSRTRVVTAKLLSTVTTKANGQTARVFELSYEQGVSGRSRLRQIKADPQPAVTFAYQNGGNGIFTAGPSAKTEGENNAGYVFHGHCDSDGYPDLLKFNSTSATPYVFVYLSDGAGGYGGKIGTKLAGGANQAGYLLVADFDADGSADIVKVETSGTTGIVYFHRGLGNGSFAAGVRSDLGGMNDRGRILVGDVLGQDGRLELIKLRTLSGQLSIHRLKANGTFDAGAAVQLGAAADTGRILVLDCDGDRRDDLVRVHANSKISVYRSNGDGTLEAPIETDLGNGPNDPGCLMIGDFNGDGLADLLKIRSLSSRVYSHLSLGNGRFTAGTETDLGGAAIEPGRMLVADVDKDGLADVVRHYFNSSAVDCYRSNGTGSFNSAARTDATFGALFKGYVALANVDGRGGADLIRRSRNGDIYTAASNPNAPDLLVNAANGVGATFSLAYSSSAEFDNLYLPFNVDSLAELTVDDGNGIVATTRFSFADGYYDPKEASFQGFAEAERVLPDRSRELIRYHHGEYLRGKPQKLEHLSPSGSLLSKTTMSWSAAPLSGSARFVKMDEKRLEHYFDPTVFTREEFQYSSINGHVVSRTRSGTNAEAITETHRHVNCGSWNWRPDRFTLSGANEGIVQETFFGYDNRGNKIREERWNNQGENPVAAWAYDVYGNPVEKTDANGNRTRYEYDAATFSYPTRIVLPATGGVGHVWKAPAFDYRVGKANRLEDENGNLTLYAYDNLGRLIQADTPDGGRRTFTHVDTAFPTYLKTTVKTDAGSPITSFDYFDGLKRRIKTVAGGENGRPVVTSYVYDVMGRNRRREGPSFSQANGVPWTETSYDVSGRTVRIRRTEGEHGVVAETRSHSGLAEIVTDPDGARKTTVKDHLDRVIRVVEHSEHGEIAVGFDYNGAGLLTKIVNPAGAATHYEYDSLGRLRGMSDPDMGRWTYTYDANGNLKTQTDSRSQTISMEYDGLNRLLSKSYSTADPPVLYSYDHTAVPNGIGRLYKLTNSRAIITCDEYDEMGRPLSISRRFDGSPTAYTTRSEYDSAGRLAAVIYPVDGFRVDYAYHAGTRLLRSVNGPGGAVFAEIEDYTADGKPGYLYQGNGIGTTFAYDAASARLKEIHIQSPSALAAEDLFNASYRYSPGGDIVEIADRVKFITRYYAYDKLHRLVSERSSDVNLVHPSRVARLTNDYEGTGPFHAPKRIETRGGIHDLRYDAAGNTLSGPSLSDPAAPRQRYLSYTAENMPAAISQPGALCAEGTPGTACPSLIEFAYDGENKRFRKSSAAGTTTYVGKHYEVANGFPVRHIFAGNLRVAQVAGTNVRYLHKDHLLSTVAVSDESGKLLGSTDYLPFGQNRRLSAKHVASYAYTDQELDWESGLYNYKARLYDKSTALFMTPDPYLSPNLAAAIQRSISPTNHFAQFSAGAQTAPQIPGLNPSSTGVAYFTETSQRLNRFSYVQNNPLGFIDSEGLWSEADHNKIISEAFSHLPEANRISIEKGSRFADSFRFQRPKFNHMHAQRQKGQSAESASAQMYAYVSEHMKNYIDLKNAGELEKAYFELGMALHPIMDSTSPSHAGFQIWEGFFNTPGYKLLAHWFREWEINEQQLNATVDLIREIMDNLN